MCGVYLRVGSYFSIIKLYAWFSLITAYRLVNRFEFSLLMRYTPTTHNKLTTSKFNTC